MSDDQFEEPAYLSSGWSITVGDLRKAIDGVPDDYEVMLENADVDDIDIASVNINRLYPPSATGSPGLFILGGGQVLNAEYDYDNRMTAHQTVGGEQWWDDKASQWKDSPGWGD